MNNPFQMILSANNPKELFFNMLQQNPQMQQNLQALMNSGGGASMEQMTRQMARQMGISDEQLMQMYNRLKR